MIYDLSQLAVIGLGSEGTSPQPYGNHLRWAFGRGLSFPEGGFDLYRRQARGIDPRRLDFDFPLGVNQVAGDFSLGDINCHTPQPLTVSRNLGPKGETGLYADEEVTVTLKLPEECRWARAVIFANNGAVRVTGFAKDRVVARAKEGEFEIDGLGLTKLEVTLKEAVLTQVCFQPEFENVDESPVFPWELLTKLNLPLVVGDIPGRAFFRSVELQNAYQEWVALAIMTLRDQIRTYLPRSVG